MSMRLSAFSWWLLAVTGLADPSSSRDGGFTPSPLAGTWALVAAERWLPDGGTVDDYGTAPTGRLIVDARGRYALQIYRSDRPRFASADKAKGTPSEYRDAVMGESAHFGAVEVDAPTHTLVFHLDGASFPNWEGTIQKRQYTLKDGELRYRVPPRPDGSVPISVWRRID